jgi:glycine hydroxymethyltransferase
MGEAEMRQIADWITEVLEAPSDRSRIDRVHESVRELCLSFPLYPELVAVS